MNTYFDYQSRELACLFAVMFLRDALLMLVQQGHCCVDVALVMQMVGQFDDFYFVLVYNLVHRIPHRLCCEEGGI
jgi:hypothetical protein